MTNAIWHGQQKYVPRGFATINMAFMAFSFISKFIGNKLLLYRLRERESRPKVATGMVRFV